MADPSDELEDDEPETRPEIADRPVRPNCPGCGYDLSGTLEAPEQRCPECGRAWTVEELALQHALRAAGAHPSGRLLEAIGPGLTIGGLLLVGLIFGPPVTWLTLPVAAVLLVLATIEWARDLYSRSFNRPRSRLDRFAYVTGLTSLLILANAALLALTGLLIVIAISASGMLSVGSIG